MPIYMERVLLEIPGISTGFHKSIFLLKRAVMDLLPGDFARIRRERRILVISVAGNGVALIMVVILVMAFAETGIGYCRFGPGEMLTMIGVKIDSWSKWVLASALIVMLGVVDVLVNEFSSPILGFSVYNPDKNIIKGYTRLELQVLANLQFFFNAARYVLSTMFIISQLDFAVIQLLSREITTVFTIRKLLEQKLFVGAGALDGLGIGDESETGVELLSGLDAHGITK